MCRHPRSGAVTGFQIDMSNLRHTACDYYYALSFQLLIPNLLNHSLLQPAAQLSSQKHADKCISETANDNHREDIPICVEEAVKRDAQLEISVNAESITDAEHKCQY